MRKKITLMLMVAFIGLPLLADGPTVEFTSEYKDLDTSAITKIYVHDGSLIPRSEGEAIANKILTYVGKQDVFYIDEDYSDEEGLLYRHVDDTSGYLFIDLFNGEVAFCKGMNEFMVEADTPDLPDEDDADAIARAHLVALGMMPAYTIYLHDVGTFKMMAIDEDGKGVEYKKMINLAYGGKFNGVGVIGGRMGFISIGAGSELVNLIWNFKEFVTTSITPTYFLKPTDVRANITAQLQAGYPNADTVRVLGNHLGFYDDGMGNGEPVSFMRAEVISSEGDTVSIDLATPLGVAPLINLEYLNRAPKDPEDNGEPNYDPPDEEGS